MHGTRGYGEAFGHHGELVQGVFEDDESQLRRGLVSLPCHRFKSKVFFEANNTNRVGVIPRQRKKARRAAELTLDAFARTKTGGHLTIESNIPAGRGMGSSTADVVATILAIRDCLDIDTTSERVMQIAVSAEEACDSTLFSQQAVLFGHRDGITIEVFKKPLPRFAFISIDTMPGAAVNTLEFEPARYSHCEIQMFRALRSFLRRAVATQDVGLLGKVATASALINERFLPKPHLAEIQAIGVRHNALGIQVAHSGTVVGLLFDTADERTCENMHLAAGELREIGSEPSIFCH